MGPTLLTTYQIRACCVAGYEFLLSVYRLLFLFLPAFAGHKKIIIQLHKNKSYNIYVHIYIFFFNVIIALSVTKYWVIIIYWE